MEIKVAAIQMDAGTDKIANITEACQWITKAAREGAQIVALPEVFNYRGGQQDEVCQGETIPGPTTESLAKVARQHGIYLVGGTILETIPDSEKVYNTCVVFDPQGHIIGEYRKIHLFDIAYDSENTISESRTREHGKQPVVLDTPLVKMGLSVCYDLRFPELYRALALQAAELIFVPSAFLLQTGKDHWEVLLRARAIENQVFIVAPNAMGRNRVTGTHNYGHSMIVDPWGNVLAQMPDRPGFIMATLELDDIQLIRKRLPTLGNRRLDFRI